MNTRKIFIENLKCHGCANTIKREIGRLDGVDEISVEFEDASVNITYHEDKDPFEKVVRRLNLLGYPQLGTNSTINKAKSYVSCAIGRITDDKGAKG